jgi:radical SAM protein with 4Fe4S-binding SPASM domain
MRGIFPRIERGVGALNPGKVLRVALFTLCGENYHVAAEFPHQLGLMGFVRVIFQNLIYCTGAQARDYRHWLKNSFGQDAPHLDPWISDEAEPWTAHLPEVAKNIQANIAAGNYPIEVKLFPDEINAENITSWFDASIHLKKDRSACLMPFRHLQIQHDGNVHFCVDFNDFTLGNIRDSSITELFHNERARRFRAEGPACNALCARCPWYYNECLVRA